MSFLNALNDFSWQFCMLGSQKKTEKKHLKIFAKNLICAIISSSRLVNKMGETSYICGAVSGFQFCSASYLFTTNWSQHGRKPNWILQVWEKWELWEFPGCHWSPVHSQEDDGLSQPLSRHQQGGRTVDRHIPCPLQIILTAVWAGERVRGGKPSVQRDKQGKYMQGLDWQIDVLENYFCKNISSLLSYV